MGPKVGLWWSNGLFWEWKIYRTGRPNVPRRKGASPEDGNSQLLSHPRSLSPFYGPFGLPPPLPSALGDLCRYISISSVHPPPTLVSHPCPYSSARPIGHSLWRSVSCCDPHCTVQWSHPHQWGQGVSCEYLIRRWQLLLGLLFYRALMASS